MKLQGKRVVLTGGTGEIGSYVANNLQKEGAVLTCVSHDTPKKPLAGVRYIQSDLSCYESISALCDTLAQYPMHNHFIDLVIHLAGLQYFGEFEYQRTQSLQQLMTVNLIAPMLLTHAILPQMKARKSGRIAVIGSIMGSINLAHMVSYSASKAGLKGFCEGLRRELKGSGVGVSYVAPRAVKTAFNQGVAAKWLQLTKTNMDEPKQVAEKIICCIKKESSESYFGLPESIFVRVNALFPKLVDSALDKQANIARELLQQGREI